MAKSAIKTIWKRIPGETKRLVLSDIVTKGGVSINTAYRWTTGGRTPLPLYQQLIAAILNEHTGKDYTALDLFPDN